jgi:sugar phosphate isomerase/epimerase
MSNFPIACQTITWGNEQAAVFPRVFDEVKAAGFTGVEIGFRHIRQVPPADIKRMLDDRGLALACLHIGGNLLDAGQADDERRTLDLAFEYLTALGAEFLVYSGLRYQNDVQFARDFLMLNSAAQECHAIGKRLLYHNHNWEFQGDARIINALMEKGSHHLGFCPDVGWVMKGGWHIAQFLDRIKERLYAIHFKDFATDGPWCDTVVLGTGIAPLKEAADWMKGNTEGMWVVAEQDTADIAPGQAATENAAFLKGLFGL